MCARNFDEFKCMSFLIKEDALLEKYNKTGNNFNSSIRKDFHSNPLENEKYLKAKIKSYDGKI